MSADPSERIAVVGGGIAGMATALGLVDRGFGVTLFERRPFLGGRVFSFEDPGLARRVDNGQHAMLGCYHHTLAFLDRIGARERLYRHGLRIEMRENGKSGRLDAGRTPAPFHLTRALWKYRLLSRAEQAMAARGALRLLFRWKRNPPWFAERTVRQALDELGQSARVQRLLWDPIAIAALNADPGLACASLFAAVVEQAFFGRAADAEILLPAVPLSDLFGIPGRDALANAGVELRERDTVSAIELDEEGKVLGLRTRAGVVHECDAVVLALPPRAIGGLSIGSRGAGEALGPWVETLSETVPIVSVHVPIDEEVDLPALVGLVGTTTQWVFNVDAFIPRPEGASPLLSCVVSDAVGLDGFDDRTIAERTVGDLQQNFPSAGPFDASRVRVVRERHATIVSTVEATAARPPVTTSTPGLFLAGDWIRTGLPATIESAALSGNLAADAVLQSSASRTRRAIRERAA